MKGKFVLFFAVLCLGGAGYWAYQEGVLDDILPWRSGSDDLSAFDDGQSPKGPVGPVSKVPALERKAASTEKKSQKTNTDPRNIEAVLDRLFDETTAAVSLLDRPGPCRARMRRSLNGIRKVRKAFTKWKEREKRRPGVDNTESLKKFIAAFLRKRKKNRTLIQHIRQTTARFGKKCPRQAAVYERKMNEIFLTEIH